MWDEQMEFANKLAQFEVINNELDAEKLEKGASFLSTVPKPAPWVTDPRPQPHWSIEENKLVAENNKGPKDIPKIPKNLDVLKTMCVCVNAAWLSSELLEPLREAARACGLCLRTDPRLPRGLVTFQRLPPRATLHVTDQGVGLSDARRCLRALCVLEGGAAARLLAAGAAAGAGAGLAAHAARAQRSVCSQITLIILDVADYFKKGKNNEQLEEAKIDLIVSLGIDTACLRGERAPERLAARVVGTARALAEEPKKLTKRAIDETAQFYMRGDNRNCVTVDAHGNGLARLWQQMLSALPHGSLEQARALALRCPTPRNLLQEAQKPGGSASLAEVGVVRSGAPGARARRLGPEAARRLCELVQCPGAHTLC